MIVLNYGMASDPCMNRRSLKSAELHLELQKSIVTGSRVEVYPWKRESLEKKLVEQPQIQSDFVFLRSQSHGVGEGTEKRHQERHLSSPQIKVNCRALVRATLNNHPQLLFLLLVVLLLPSATHRSSGGCSEL